MGRKFFKVGDTVMPDGNTVPMYIQYKQMIDNLKIMYFCSYKPYGEVVTAYYAEDLTKVKDDKKCKKK